MDVTKQITAFAWILALYSLYSTQAVSGILPKEGVEYLHHSYDGGGIEISGPSLLVRKNIANQASVSANYYVDEISSASIDVELLASPYTEERKEKSVSLEYLHNGTTFSTALGRSDENDYNAKVGHFGISQEFFGGLSTLTLGISRGQDDVRRRNDPNFLKEVDRHHFRFGFTQIITKYSLLNVNLETITDEGYLNNPYRQYRYSDNSSTRGFSTAVEVYPQTRTSNAGSLQLKYYLKYRAAFKGTFRYFRDSWDIKGHTYDFEYIHPFKELWTASANLRFYRQNAASFYSDLFTHFEAQDFLARDKEMSKFSSVTFGFGISYKIPEYRPMLIKEGSVSFLFNRMQIDYDNFRDATQEGFAVGEEPLYSLSANVIRLLLQLNY